MRYKEFETSLSRTVFRVAPNRGGELYTDSGWRQQLIKINSYYQILTPLIDSIQENRFQLNLLCFMSILKLWQAPNLLASTQYLAFQTLIAFLLATTPQWPPP